MEEVIVSRSRDPRWNLAFEEYLIEKGKSLMFLWQNDPSVILGRNQDPYAECEPGILEKEHVYLVRRKSGGGAVYHDRGNLNITFLSTKSPKAVERNFSFLKEVLKELGAEAEVSGRNDLECGGKKISGSAFYETDTCFCHHCTMLVDIDGEAISRFLTPSPLKLQSRGIKSVRSRVCGLSEINPQITVEVLQKALTDASGGNVREVSEDEMKKIPQAAEKKQRYASWEWTFGESPGSNLTLERKFSWGLVRADLLVVSGRIRECRIYTDSLFTDGFETFEKSLCGLPLYGKGCIEAAGRFPNPEISSDLIKLFTPKK